MGSALHRVRQAPLFCLFCSSTTRQRPRMSTPRRAGQVVRGTLFGVLADLWIAPLTTDEAVHLARREAAAVGLHP